MPFTACHTHHQPPPHTQQPHTTTTTAAMHNHQAREGDRRCTPVTRHKRTTHEPHNHEARMQHTNSATNPNNKKEVGPVAQMLASTIQISNNNPTPPHTRTPRHRREASRGPAV